MVVISQQKYSKRVILRVKHYLQLSRDAKRYRKKRIDGRTGAGYPERATDRRFESSPIRLVFQKSEAVAIGATRCRSSNGCGLWPEVSERREVVTHLTISSMPRYLFLQEETINKIKG